MTGREYNSQFTPEELATEVWKDVPDYEGDYQASSLGRIRSVPRYRRNIKGTALLKGRLILPRFRQDGRAYIRLHKINIIETISIHRVILFSFIGPCPEGMEGCHNDFNYLNNRPENLRWDTHKNNIKDREKQFELGGRENFGYRKLSKYDVLKIIKMYKTKKYPQWKLGEIFNVSQTAISSIIVRRNWGWLKK